MLYAWEVDEEFRLVATSSSAPSPSQECFDNQIWSGAASGSGTFSVSALYSFSNSLLGPDSQNQQVCLE